MRFWLLLLCFSMSISAQPRRAYQYRADLKAQVERIWGLGTDRSLFAAQIHQESSWRPQAKSPWAEGLAQFTPDTADWINRLDSELAALRDVYNPKWAIRALVFYDKFLWDRFDWAHADSRWAFTLASYNGGAGWISRERKGLECDNTYWWCCVELNCIRSEAACKENRNYPRKVLSLQSLYTGF
jgi:soluble lytic murein transglycosylase-like protein